MFKHLKNNHAYLNIIIFGLILTINFAIAQNHWFTQNSGTSVHLRAISFVNADTGYVVGYNGTILKTLNGGFEWQQLNSGTSVNFMSVCFLNKDVGWACGGFSPGVILQTTDGGINWASLPSPTSNLLMKIFFINDSIGWITGNGFQSGIAYQTTDGGMTWNNQLNYSAWLPTLYFINSYFGWAVGSDIIYNTTNGGSTWTPQFAPFDAELYSVFFLDSLIGWTAGTDRIGVEGIILRTINGGTTWERFDDPIAFSDLYFVNKNTGFVVGESGSILGTTDGGISWTSQFSGVSDYLYDVEFPNSIVGYIVGQNGVILKTETGGMDIHDIEVTRVQNSNSGGFFLQTGEEFQANTTIRNNGNNDENNFYIIAEVRKYPSNTLVYADSFLVATLNAGVTMDINFNVSWSIDTTGNYYLSVKSTLTGDMNTSNNQLDVELNVVNLPGELSFDDGINEQIWEWNNGTGGIGIYFKPPTYPIKITELKAYLDAGTTPTFLELYDDNGTNSEPDSIIGSFLINATTADWYFINLIDSNFVIEDGGVYAVWRMNGITSSGLGLDQSSISSRQTWEYNGNWSVFRNFNTEDAMIRISVENYPSGHVTPEPDFNIPLSFLLRQNYPNPFNPVTTISFDLPKSSKVTLTIFNVLGEEVATLVSDRLLAGSYSYKWDANQFASGVYLFRLSAGEQVKTKKMLLLH